MLLGIEYFSGKRYKKNIEKGLALITKAADGGLSHAQLQLAWIYSTSSDKHLLNVEKAEHYFAMINKKSYHDRLSYYETLSAINAAKNDFKQALKLQKKALKEAKKYDLPGDALIAANNLYKQNQPLVVTF